MFELNDIFHIGIIVPALDEGMRDLGARFGCTWAPPRTIEVRAHTSRGNLDAALSVTYSRQGPPHFELIESLPGTLWAAEAGSRIHHLGIYVDDLRTEIVRLERLGLALEAAGLDPDGGFERFAFHNNPLGVRVELVDSIRRAAHQAWLRQ